MPQPIEPIVTRESSWCLMPFNIVVTLVTITLMNITMGAMFFLFMRCGIQIYKKLMKYEQWKITGSGKSLLTFQQAISLLLNSSSKAARFRFCGLLLFDSVSLSIIARAILAMIL